jgi:hypothetical protein
MRKLASSAREALLPVLRTVSGNYVESAVPEEDLLV